jgi:hypothetical protein
MAGTVTSQLTNVTLAESADDINWDDIVGGPGSGQVDGSAIQGAESRGRRIDTTIRGFSYDTNTPRDISAANTHVGFYIQVTQPNLINVDGIELVLGDNASPKAGNWSGFFFDETSYPPAQSWLRIWLDPSRTRDTGAGTLPLATIRQFGCEFDMGNVGGTSESCLMDRIDYTATGLLITAGTIGSPATFANFVAEDENIIANRYGVVQTTAGVVFVNARLIIGSAVATVFTDNGFTIAYASQELASSTFLGVSIDLTNASTAVTFTGGSFKSGGATILGDFIVAGTSGTLVATGTVYDRVRVISLTSGCTLNSCTIANSGAITATSAVKLLSCSINLSTAASALIWNLATDLNTYLDGTRFTSSGTGHAIELGTSSPTSVTLTGMNFTGYAGTSGSTGNEAIWVKRTTGTVTINISGGSTPSIRTDGATVIVSNTITVSVNVKDSASQTVISGARVYMEADTGGPLPALASVSIARSGSTATVTHTAHGLITGQKVKIRGATQLEYVGTFIITVTTANEYTYTVAGTPTTPATGTITSTAVILDGDSNVSGTLEDTGFNYVSSQPIKGRVRKGTTTPLYRTFPFSGSISAAGLNQSVFLSRDD